MDREIAAAISASLLLGCSSNSKEIQLPEFGISALIPAAGAPCEALSGEHLIGYFGSLESGKSCDELRAARDRRMLSLVANFNSSFEDVLQVAHKDGCDLDRKHLVSITETRVDGWPAVECRSSGGAEGVVISVVTAAGKWEGFGVGREAQTPRIRYQFKVTSDPIYIQQDEGRFRQFLKSVKIAVRD